MLEGWGAELLAGYLGHFVDIQKEQLRISLWSGEMHVTMHANAVHTLLAGMHPSTDKSLTWRHSGFAAWKSGVTLQNVKLKAEAFDYLQLPVDVKEGIVGRLQVQVPHSAACVPACPLARHDIACPQTVSASCAHCKQRDCLHVQVPWHPFTGRLLQIALSDVYLQVGPRKEADWEEGPAGKRAEVHGELNMRGELHSVLHAAYASHWVI